MKRITLFLSFLLALSSLSFAQNESKTLVVYFSATGNTRAAAERLANDLHAPTWEIEPAEHYSAADLDWHDRLSRSSVEMNDENERPAIRQCTNIMPYDTICVGYPIWWGVCPRIINSWIDNNLPQLETKTLIPFATSGSSSIDASVNYLRKTYPSLHWQNGILMR